MEALKKAEKKITKLESIEQTVRTAPLAFQRPSQKIEIDLDKLSALINDEKKLIAEIKRSKFPISEIIESKYIRKIIELCTLNNSDYRPDVLNIKYFFMRLLHKYVMSDGLYFEHLEDKKSIFICLTKQKLTVPTCVLRNEFSPMIFE